MSYSLSFWEIETETRGTCVDPKAPFKQARDGESESERAGYAAAKELYELALEEYKQSRRDYLPLSPAEGIKAPPVARAAYSDRMAWLMANMADMAYIRFDSGYEPDEEERIARQKREIERLNFCLQSGQHGRHKPDDKQSDAGLSFELVKMFDTSEGHKQGTKKTDTQAFLAKSSTFAVLSLRHRAHPLAGYLDGPPSGAPQDKVWRGAHRFQGSL